MKTLSLFACLLLLPASILAQRNYFELGGFLGVANYQGDLAEDHIEIGETKASIGGIVRVHYNDKLMFKGNVYYGRVSGSDANATNENLSRRNWSFEADLLELAINAEFVPFGKPRFNKASVFRPQVNPYVFAGVGITFANDRLDVSNSGLDLGNLPQPFPEPDDRDNFLVVPAGVGIRIDFTQWTTLSGEWGWRYAFSDYIDGVSENGNKEGLDWYLFGGVTLTFFFGEQEDFGL